MTKNAAANLARAGASWIVVLLLPPLLVRVLDKPSYATWVLILQIGAYVTLVDGGIQSAIGRFVARAEGLQDHTYLGQVLSGAGAILLVGALAASAMTCLCAWQMGHLFRAIPASILPGARGSVLIIGISLALGLPFSTFAGTFLGLQKNEVNALAGSLGKLAGSAGAGWAAWRHDGLLAMALWIGAGNLLQSLMYLVAWKRLRIAGILRRSYVAGGVIREFAKFCGAMFATQFSTLLITGMDMPVVVAFDFRAAAYYAVASTASSMLAGPHGAVITTLIPIASGMSTKETPERLGQIVKKTTRYGTGVLCLLTIPLLLALGPFLRFWVGADYASHALPLALVLIVAQFVRLTLMPYAVIGFGTGQQHRMLISPLAEGIVNLACSVAGAWMWGAIGVAVGTLIGAIVGVVVHFINSMPRTDTMLFSRRGLLIGAILRPIACSLLPLLLGLWLEHSIGSLSMQLGAAAAATALAMMLLWWANFNENERSEMLGILRRGLNASERLSGAGA